MTTTTPSGWPKPSSRSRLRKFASRGLPMLLAAIPMTLWTSFALAQTPNLTGVKPLTIAPDVPRWVEVKEPSWLVLTPPADLSTPKVEAGSWLVSAATAEANTRILYDYAKLPEYCAAEARAHDAVWRRSLLSHARVAAREVQSATADVEADHADDWSPLRAGLGIGLGVVGGFIVGAIAGGLAVWFLTQNGQVIVVGAQ